MRVIASDQAIHLPPRRPGSRIDTYAYLGIPAEVNPGPQTFLVANGEPGGTVKPHFHDVDQFQVVAAGDGKFGKKPIRAGAWHYADGYSPYGPIVANERGISFYTIRLACANGFYPMPGSRDKMPGKAGRNLGGQFDLEGPRPAPGIGKRELLEEQADGVRVTGIRLGPDAKSEGFAVRGSAAYVLVMGGGLRVRGETIPERSLVYLAQGESIDNLAAGGEGADLLQLEFSVPSDRPGSNPQVLARRPAGPYALPASVTD